MKKALLLTFIALVAAIGAWGQGADNTGVRKRVNKNVYEGSAGTKGITSADQLVDGHYYVLHSAGDRTMFDRAYNAGPTTAQSIDTNESADANTNQQPQEVWILEKEGNYFYLRNAYTFQYIHTITGTGYLYTTPYKENAALFNIEANKTSLLYGLNFYLSDTKNTTTTYYLDNNTVGVFGNAKKTGLGSADVWYFYDVTDNLNKDNTIDQYLVKRTFKYEGTAFKDVAERSDEIWVDKDTKLQSPIFWGLYNKSTTANGEEQSDDNGTFTIEKPSTMVYTYEDNPNEDFPFSVSTDEKPRWYVVISRNLVATSRVNVLSDGTTISGKDIVTKRDDMCGDNTLKWAFRGDPINGFYMWNKNADSSKPLTIEYNTDADRLLNSVKATVGGNRLTPFFVEKHGLNKTTFSLRFDDKVANVTNYGDGVYLAKNTGEYSYRSWTVTPQTGQASAGYWYAFRFLPIDTLYSNEYKNKDYVGGIPSDEQYNKVREDLFKAIDECSIDKWITTLDNLPKVDWEMGAYYWIRSAYEKYNDPLSDYENETAVYVWENTLDDFKKSDTEGFKGQPCMEQLDRSKVKFLWQANKLPKRLGANEFSETETTIGMRAANYNHYFSQCGISTEYWNYAPVNDTVIDGKNIRNGIMPDDLGRAQWRVIFNRKGVSTNENDKNALQFGSTLYYTTRGPILETDYWNQVISRRAYTRLLNYLPSGRDRNATDCWYFQKANAIEVIVKPKKGYTTFMYPFAVKVPEYVDCWIPVTGQGDDVLSSVRLVVTEVTPGSVIPAGTPVICIADPGSYDFPIITEGKYLITDNKQFGEISDQYVVKGTTMGENKDGGYYLLSDGYGNGEVLVRDDNVMKWPQGLVWKKTKNPLVGSILAIPQNKIYIPAGVVPDKQAEAKEFFGDMDFDEPGDKITSGIDSVTNNSDKTKAPTDVYYNLDGTRATKLESGKVYINSNGKKYFIF